MQARIDRLEGLVLRLMGSGGNHVSPSTDRERSESTDNGTNKSKRYDDDDVGMDSIHGDEKHRNEGESDGDVEEVRSALGIMKVDQGKSYYRGGTHWAAILSEVRARVAHYFLASGVGHQIVLKKAHQSLNSLHSTKPPCKLASREKRVWIRCLGMRCGFHLSVLAADKQLHRYLRLKLSLVK